MLNTHILHLTSQCHQVPTVHVWAIFIPTKAVETTMFQIAKVRPSTVQWRILTTEKKNKKKQKCWKWQMLNTLRYDYLCEKTVCSFFTQHFPEVWFSPSTLAFSARSNHLSKTSGWTSASQSHAKLLGRVWAGPNIQKNLVSGWVCQSHSRLSGESSCHESRVTLIVWSKRPHVIIVIYLTIRPHDG